MSKLTEPQLAEIAARHGKGMPHHDLDLCVRRLLAHIAAVTAERDEAEANIGEVNQLLADTLSRTKIAEQRAEDAARVERDAVVAWSNVAPTKSGLYWNWNGDYDCCPIPLHVGWSGPNGPCFVMRGQYCIETAIDCDEYGGWWAPLQTPAPPAADAIERGEHKGGGDGK